MDWLGCIEGWPVGQSDTDGFFDGSLEGAVDSVGASLSCQLGRMDLLGCSLGLKLGAALSVGPELGSVDGAVLRDGLCDGLRLGRLDTEGD